VAELRRLEPYYFMIWYGLPMAASITFLFVQSESRGRVYGPAIVRIHSIDCGFTNGNLELVYNKLFMAIAPFRVFLSSCLVCCKFSSKISKKTSDANKSGLLLLQQLRSIY
jgi:hypothetical protein